MKAGDNEASEKFYKSCGCGFKRYLVNMDSNKRGTLSLKPDGGVCMFMKV